MADIRTIQIDPAGGFGFALDGADLTEDEGLDTAVILSLFTDRQAGDDDVIPGGSSDRRGCWLDGFAGHETEGSRLWLLEQAKLTEETVTRAREYCEEALAWLVADGVAGKIKVETWIERRHPLGVIGALIDIVKPDGTILARYKFASLWRAV